MSKSHIWVGTFKSEIDFNDYVEERKGKSRFAEEINLDFLDEDFLHIHFEKTDNFDAFFKSNSSKS